MKKLLLFFMLLTIAAQAQNWPPPPEGNRYIGIQKFSAGQLEEFIVETRGGVPTGELDELSLASMVSGEPGRAYYSFDGEEFYDSLYHIPGIEFTLPPGIFTEDYLYTARNKFRIVYSYHSTLCSCDCIEGGLDTLLNAVGFGFWWLNPLGPPSFWGINEGYNVYSTWLNIWRKIPCPPAPPWYGKDPLYFTDADFNSLPDKAVVSGQSPLYLKAHTSTPVTQLQVTLRVDSPGAVDHLYNMENAGNNDWHLQAPPACSLGLKSFSTVKAFTHHPYTDSTWDSDELTVALPKIFTMVDSTLTDTVFIRSDSMKIAGDVKVGLAFIGDNTSMQVDPTSNDSLVACAGYKYKSRWIANENLADTLQKTYYRQYPRDSLTYLWWNDTTAKCLTTFKRDSLYVVGGKLTILGKGLLKEIIDGDSIYNIDNSFKVTTDTFNTANQDTFRTKLILIDKDPTNNEFKTKLGTDQARAIAWQEYAGSADVDHCHDGTGNNAIYNPHWNHYWDTFILATGDTCPDSKVPCENHWGLDTGIMQIYRSTWENTFDTTGHHTDYPYTFIIGNWDSLAWNWKINIDNGKWIFQEAMPHKFTKSQKEYPDSCSYANCDSVPDIANKEDLANYGYHAGEFNMRRITSQDLWKDYINTPTDTLEIERANYIKMVRRYKYRGNLW